MLRSVIVTASIATFAVTAAVPATAGTCMSPEESRHLPFMVMQQAPPPAVDDDPAYRFWPASAASSLDVAKLNASRSTRVEKYWFHWANRCHTLPGSPPCGWNPKGNFVYPRLKSATGEIRTHFTSHAAADACTLAQAAHVLGAPEAVVAGYVARGHLTAAAMDESVRDRAQGGKLIDVCLMPRDKLAADGRGVVLDYEVQDRRTPDQSRDFLLEYAALVHSLHRKAILFSNPLDAPTQRYTGLGPANATALGKAFDAVTIMLWSGNRQKDLRRSAEIQLAMFDKEVPRDRILPVFELARTGTADAAAVRELIETHELKGVMIWRNQARMDDACAPELRAKLACLIGKGCR